MLPDLNTLHLFPAKQLPLALAVLLPPIKGLNTPSLCTTSSSHYPSMLPSSTITYQQQSCPRHLLSWPSSRCSPHSKLLWNWSPLPIEKIRDPFTWRLRSSGSEQPSKPLLWRLKSRWEGMHHLWSLRPTRNSCYLSPRRPSVLLPLFRWQRHHEYRCTQWALTR